MENIKTIQTAYFIRVLDCIVLGDTFESLDLCVFVLSILMTSGLNMAHVQQCQWMCTVLLKKTAALFIKWKIC